MTFSEYFKLGKNQAELDFVDIDPNKDLPLFIDPFVLSSQANDWTEECNACITSFFETLIDFIRDGNDRDALRMLSKLGEPNETCFGLSRSIPSGRGIGTQQANDLLQNIKRSKAVKTGLISDIAELDLFVEKIGPDKISDMTTNILRGLLIKYTQDQCYLHGIELNTKSPSGWIWSPEDKRWGQDYTFLPIIDGKTILLVPKFMVRWSMILNNTDYYNNFVTCFIRDDELKLNGQLVEVLKSGDRRVTKKNIKEKHPKNKDFLATFSEQHPEVLKKYRETKEKQSVITISNNEFIDKITSGETVFNEKDFAQFLQAILKDIKPGDEDASRYHSFMIGVLQFIFDSDFIYPKKERQINDGRKRIDISYTNASIGGFFNRIFTAPNILAQEIMVECKNYTKDPTNPEVDQLRGRFDPRRGNFGLMLYRNTSDKNLLQKRCRDVTLAHAGYIIALDDSDINTLLEYISKGRRSFIDSFLQERLDYLNS